MKFYRKKSIKKKSAKKILRDECGKLHLEVLKIKRGAKDEIDGRPANGLGRFHILEVSTNPRLEFVDENILLVNWLPSHFNWHHYGEGSPKNIKTLQRIKELRGDDYRNKLEYIEKFMEKHDELYIRCRIGELKKELEDLNGLA